MTFVNQIDPMMRCYKRVLIDPVDVLNCFAENFKSPSDVINKISLRVPPNTEFVDCMYDFVRRAFILTLRHGSWPTVPLGQEPPRLEVKVEQIALQSRPSEGEEVQPTQ